MSDWKIGFKRAMIKALVDGGSPVRDDPSFYGWEDYDHHWPPVRHPKRIMIDRVGIDFDATTYRESVWAEFQGTFYEGDTRVYGVDLDLVLCNGKRLRWRYTGTVSKLLTAVLGPDNVVGDQGA